MGVLGVLLVVLAFLGVAPGGSFTLHWNSTSCYLVKPIPGHPLGSLSFLGKDAQGLALFQALWDAHFRLKVCIRQAESELVRAFRVLCTREPWRHSFIHTPGPELQRALAALQSQWEACHGTDSPTGAREKRATEQSRAADREHGRRRRGWTIPGTLWCGVGDSAENSSELGVFHGPDLCCREHDQCPQTISPLQYNYGIRNFRFHTISHCDCDARFQQCLRSQRDSISDIMGVAFFNVLEIPCFVLKEQEACVAWHWWGGCRAYGSGPLAHLQPRTYYNASWKAEVTSPTPRPHSPAPSKHSQKRRPQQTQSGHQTTTTTLQMPAGSHRPDMVPRAQPGVPHPGYQDGPKLQDAHRVCRVFRHLDQCEHKIKPQETKFHLLNSAQMPLFHCNCTRRLARFLRLHSPPAGTNKVWELLGTTCFKLTLQLDCAEGKGCSRDHRAIKVSARHLQRLQQKRLHFWGKGTDGTLAWPLEPSGTSGSFYSQCLQLTQAIWRAGGQKKFWSS